jgi:hypothetical protein
MISSMNRLLDLAGQGIRELVTLQNQAQGLVGQVRVG